MHIGLPLMDWLLTLLLFSLSPTPSLFLRSKNLLLSSQCKTVVQPAIIKTVSVVRQKRFIALTPNVKFRAISFFSLRENLVVSTRRFYRSLESNKNLPKCLQPKKQISCWSYRLKCACSCHMTSMMMRTAQTYIFPYDPLEKHFWFILLFYHNFRFDDKGISLPSFPMSDASKITGWGNISSFNLH